MKKFYLWQEIINLWQAIKLIENTISWKKEMLRILQQWAISDDVFNLEYVQNYLKQWSWNCLGYRWEERSKRLDVFIEKNRPSSKSKLWQRLCSKSSRYFAEEKKPTKELLKKYFKERDWQQ